MAKDDGQLNFMHMVLVYSLCMMRPKFQCYELKFTAFFSGITNGVSICWVGFISRRFVHADY